MKMNQAKIAHWEKWNLELIEISAHTTEFLASGNALLARPYLYLKKYITFPKNVIMEYVCLDFYIVENSPDLENLPLSKD